MGLFSRDLDNVRDGFGKSIGAGLAASAISLCILTYQSMPAFKAITVHWDAQYYNSGSYDVSPWGSGSYDVSPIKHPRK